MNQHLSYGGEPPASDPAENEKPADGANALLGRPEFRGFSCPESSNIAGVFYEEAVSRLRMTFKNGSQYDYQEVPIAVYEEMRHASSVGKAFDSLVRKASYEYRRVADRVVGMEETA